MYNAWELTFNVYIRYIERWFPGVATSGRSALRVRFVEKPSWLGYLEQLA